MIDERTFWTFGAIIAALALICLVGLGLTVASPGPYQ